MLAEQYLNGLVTYLKKYELDEELEDLALIPPASDEDIRALLKAYPECPQTLLDLLKLKDGTYWRDIPQAGRYDGNSVAVPVLASMDYEYPHYLLSALQMVTDKVTETDSISDCYGGDLSGLEEIDDRIDSNLPKGQWLHFTDCINNGGTSSLYIDFDPALGGVKGQIIEYVHDPDTFKIINNSIDEYLQAIIDAGYPFLDD